MSGGTWNYTDRVLATDVFGYHIDIYCGLDGDKHDENMRIVIKDNQLGDPEISAIAFDIFCLLHSFDYAESGDSDWASYREDVEAFKKRWLKPARSKQIQKMIDICTDNLKRDLYETFSLDVPKDHEAAK